jgi:hypothetical protein
MSEGKRLGVLCIILLLFLATGVLGNTKESRIFEGDTFSVTEGGELSVYDYALRFNKGSNDTKIYIEDMNSDEFVFVDLDGCSRLEHIDICYDRTSGDTIFVRLFAIVPSLVINVTVDETELFIGEETQLNITIENDRERKANITYLEYTLPSELEITEVRKAQQVGNTIIWNKTLDSLQSEVIQVLFKPLVAFKDLGVGDMSISYDNYFGEVVEETEAIEIDAEKFVDVLVDVEQSTLFIGNPFKINLTLLNNNSNEYNYSIPGVTFDKRYTPQILTSSGFVTSDSSELFWSGVLTFNESKTFSLEFLPKQSGELRIPFFIEANDTTRIVDLAPVLLFDVVSRDIEIYPELVSGEEYNSSTEYLFDITIKNLDDLVTFKNIIIKVENKNGVSEKKLNELPIQTQKTVKGFTFLTSSTDSSLSETIEITVTYENSLLERKTFKRSVNYFVNPYREVAVWNNITKNDDGSYQLTTFADNVGDVTALELRVNPTLPETFFVKGKPDGLLESLEPGMQELVSSFAFTGNVQFNETEFELKTVYNYEVDNVTKVYTVIENLSAMVLSVEALDDEGFFASTKSSIERVFTSTRIFVLFLVSVVLMTASLVSLTLYRRRFTISGYDGLERKQKALELKKTKFIKKESGIKKAKAQIHAKMSDLKEFMAKTKKKMEKEIPIIEEKKDGLRIRQEELMNEKKLIDKKIMELKEIEERLLKKNTAYDHEKRELEMHEEQLNRRFAGVKTRLADLTGEFEKLLEQENLVNKSKEEVTKKELGLIANKQKLIKMGSEKFSEEKISTIQEKVELEHEKNAIQEELFSLTNRKNDISSAQKSIVQQKANLEKEQNLFDANKDAVENSLKALQAQSDTIKHILDDSRSSVIEPEPGEEKKKDK